MVSITNLTKSYDGKFLFNNLNIEIEAGIICFLSGNSGCGKSTLINLIGGLESPTSGTITVNGIDVTNKKNHLNYFKNTVGFLFQNFALLENKTVYQNLNLINKKIRTNYTIEEVLKLVNLESKINNKVYTLSGGEQQRIALARLLLKKCDLILADEPTGSLDDYNSKIVFELLNKLKNDGKTIIIVTHDDKIKNKGDVIVEL